MKEKVILEFVKAPEPKLPLDADELRKQEEERNTKSRKENETNGKPKNPT